MRLRRMATPIQIRSWLLNPMPSGTACYKRIRCTAPKLLTVERRPQIRLNLGRTFRGPVLWCAHACEHLLFGEADHLALRLVGDLSAEANNLPLCANPSSSGIPIEMCL